MDPIYRCEGCNSQDIEIAYVVYVPANRKLETREIEDAYHQGALLPHCYCRDCGRKTRHRMRRDDATQAS